MEYRRNVTFFVSKIACPSFYFFNIVNFFFFFRALAKNVPGLLPPMYLSFFHEVVYLAIFFSTRSRIASLFLYNLTRTSPSPVFLCCCSKSYISLDRASLSFSFLFFFLRSHHHENASYVRFMRFPDCGLCYLAWHVYFKVPF